MDQLSLHPSDQFKLPAKIQSEPAGQPALETAEAHSGSIYERSNLTRLQFLYWVGQTLRLKSAALNTGLTFVINAEIDAVHFQAAFHEFVARSDVLRTVVEEIEGVPRRQILSGVPRELRYVDLSQEAQPEEALQAWLHRHSGTPFTVTECLYDSALIKTATKRYVWYLCIHKLINDVSSLFLIYEGVTSLYERLQRAESIEDFTLLSFEAYLEFERAYRTSPRYKKSEAYWQQKITQKVEPATFFGRLPTKKSSRVQRVTRDLDMARSQKLRAIAEQAEAFTLTKSLSMSNVFTALHFAHLRYMSGSRHLGTLVPFHNRPTNGFRNTVGLLMELCPLQVEVAGDETFLSLMRKVSLEMRYLLLHYQHGSEVALQLNAFDVMFNYHHRPALHFQDTPVEYQVLHSGHGNDSFALHVHDLESGAFSLNFDFHEEIFTPAQREQAVQAFMILIDALLADQTQSICDVNLGECSVAAIAEVAQVEPASETKPFILPRNNLEFQLQQIWSRVLGNQSVSVVDNFFDLGGNSLQAMSLFVKVEEEFGRYLPLGTLLEAGTIEAMAVLLQNGQADQEQSGVVKIQAGQPGRRPFFCLTGAASNSLVIARIAKYLDPEQPVYTFLIPGLVSEQEVLTRVEDLAAYYLNLIRTVQPEGPYLLGGYSAGGIVVFELAQQLRRQEQEVDLLTIIDVPILNPGFKALRNLTGFLERLLRLAPDTELDVFLYLRDLIFRANYFWRRGWRETLGRYKNYLFSRNQSRAGWGAQVPDGAAQRNKNGQVPVYEILRDADGSQLEDPRVRAIFEVSDRAVRSYIPQVYPGRIVLFRSSKGYSRADLRSPDPQLGWGAVAAEGVETYIVPGGHLAIVHEPGVKILGKQLRTCLQRVQS